MRVAKATQVAQAQLLTRTAMTRAVVLEKVKHLALRDIDVNEPFTPNDVRIDICSVGICGSDVHYYQVGRPWARARCCVAELLQSH